MPDVNQQGADLLGVSRQIQDWYYDNGSFVARGAARTGTDSCDASSPSLSITVRDVGLHREIVIRQPDGKTGCGPL